jgi:DNA polymerase bacteriophage-type
MKKLWLDFETRSMIDLPDFGLDRYSKDDSTEVLMLAWAFDDDEPKIWLPILGEPMPAELHTGLTDPTVMKMAWNYNFEKDIFHYRLGYAIPQQEWFDPSVLCAYMSLPIGLDRAANALDIDIELKKTVILGKKKPTKIFSEASKRNKTYLKKNPGAAEFYYRDWNTDPDAWAVFIEYCLQDVRAERAVWYAAVAMNCPITEGETQAWLLDQRMNEQGVWIDKIFVQNAKAYALGEIKEINVTMQQLTGLAYTKSGKSLSKLDEWLQSKGYKFDSLDKAHIAEALKVGLVHWKMDPVAYQVLQLKEKLGGSAYTKLQTIEDRIGADGRLRDQFVYHGAHTGRWSGRGVQLQNLFKPSKDVGTLRERIVNAIRANTLDVNGLITEYNAECLAFNATNTDPKKERKPIKSMTLMSAVAGTIRASFSATPGNKLSVSDLAQIESRVLAALAGCQTMINAYAKGLDLYKDIMSFLLNKPYDTITSAERANGKVIILGCGFGMGWEKFIEYAATFGVTLDEKTAKQYVEAFREKYSEIPAYWKALNAAVIKATKAGVSIYVSGVVVDGRNPKMLKIKLPSGRALHYLNPRVEMSETSWGAMQENVLFDKWDAKGLQENRLYGGLICENVVQAVARDILLNGGLEAEKLGFIMIMTIHDEWVAESPIASSLTYKDLEHAMTITPEWAEGMGFVLAAEGYDAEYYRK